MQKSLLHRLLDTAPQVGRLEWIGLSPGRRQPIQTVEEVLVEVGTGLRGDRHAQSGRGKRQVTLIQAEHLPVIAAICGREEVRPEQLRRNLVVSGLNLRALKKRHFRVGSVVLEGTGPCDPCSLMEENLGPGGYNAMRGHGGITARVLEAGTIRLQDPVELIVGEPYDGEDDS